MIKFFKILLKMIFTRFFKKSSITIEIEVLKHVKKQGQFSYIGFLIPR